MVALPERLGKKTSKILQNQSNILYLSSASAWEISIKYTLGKLSLPQPPDEYLKLRLGQLNVIEMPILLSHAVLAGTLPTYHEDPFDRLLIAQSKIEKIPLITVDPIFKTYGISVINAST